MTTQCCVCGRIRDHHNWRREPSVMLNHDVSHTYCPKCYDEAVSAIDDNPATTTQGWTRLATSRA